MGTITLPDYGTTSDVYHNNELRNVIVIKEETCAVGSPEGTCTTLILWDDLGTPDQQKLIDLYEQYGSPGLPGSPPGRTGSPGAGIAAWHTVCIQNLAGGSPTLTNLSNSLTYTVTLDITAGSPPNTVTTETATIDGGAAVDFSLLIVELNAQLTGVVASIDTDGNIRFQTTAVGAGAEVEIRRKSAVQGTGGYLFNEATGFNGFKGFFHKRAGVDSAEDVLTLNRNDSNVLFSDCYSLIVRQPKPSIGVAPVDLNKAYYNGTEWVRLLDNTPI